jgi:hypothetical protein
MSSFHARQPLWLLVAGESIQTPIVFYLPRAQSTVSNINPALKFLPIPQIAMRHHKRIFIFHTCRNPSRQSGKNSVRPLQSVRICLDSKFQHAFDSTSIIR